MPRRVMHLSAFNAPVLAITGGPIQCRGVHEGAGRAVKAAFVVARARYGGGGVMKLWNGRMGGARAAGPRGRSAAMVGTAQDIARGPSTNRVCATSRA